MEYRLLIPLLAVFVAVLASEVITARRPADDIDSLEGSGFGTSERGSADEDDTYDDDDDGSDDDDEDSDSSGVVWPRTTTSVYVNGVDISSVDLGDRDEVKVRPRTSVFLHPAVLAAIIVGGVLTILFIVLIVMFVVYRMRKKDEGSYVLDDPKTMIVGTDHHQHHQASSSLVYIKAPTNDREFYA